MGQVIDLRVRIIRIQITITINLKDIISGNIKRINIRLKPRLLNLIIIRNTIHFIKIIYI